MFLVCSGVIFGYVAPRRGNYLIRRKFEQSWICLHRKHQKKYKFSMEWFNSIDVSSRISLLLWPHHEAFTQNKGICGLPNAKKCGRPCHDPTLRLVTNVKAWKGPDQECNIGVTLAPPWVWRNEHTLPSGLPLSELESLWSLEYSKRYFRNQNSLDQRIHYTIEKLLKHKCLKWASTTHLST
jgi:hypothetical protein